MSSVIRITGVLDDGASWSPKIAQPAVTIQFPRSGDVTILITVVNPAGAPVILVAPATIVFTADKRTEPLNPVPAIKKTATFPVAVSPLNVAAVTIVPADTRWLAPGRYWFDVWMTYNSKRYQIVQSAILHLQPSMDVP